MSAYSVSLCILATLFYTYAGYPLLILLLAKLKRPRPPNFEESYEPTVSFCIPVRNAKAYIRQKIESLRAIDYPADKMEILFYSDASDDGTDELIRVYTKDSSIFSLVRGDVRSGKPTGLNLLRQNAKGEVLILTDARQTISSNALRELVRPLSNDSIGLAAGSLQLSGEGGAGVYWKYERAIRKAEADLGWAVGVSGALYALRKDDFPELAPDLILDDMWVPLHVQIKKKRKVAFADKAIAFDEVKSNAGEFQRKVRTLTGNFQLFARMPESLIPRGNPIWFPLWCHKVLRLLAPWFLISLFALSLAGYLFKHEPRTIFAPLLEVQAIGYFFAALGMKYGGTLGKLARTFVVLNSAALLALFRFLRRSQPITW